jgi:putative protein kinase ArgK-like GTPase of G3E family
MAEYEIVGELVTDEDVDKFLGTWKDKPKGKKSKERRCQCGAVLARWKHKCSKCIDEERQREQQKPRLCQCGAVKGAGRQKCYACFVEAVNQHREYMREYRRKKAEERRH